MTVFVCVCERELFKVILWDKNDNLLKGDTHMHIYTFRAK